METKNDLVPAKAVHPGEILGEELKERGIKQKDFAAEIGVLPSHLNELIKGKRNVTKNIAIKLEKALDVPFLFWMNLQNSYDYDVEIIAKRNAKITECKYNGNEGHQYKKTILKTPRGVLP